MTIYQSYKICINCCTSILYCKLFGVKSSKFCILTLVHHMTENYSCSIQNKCLFMAVYIHCTLCTVQLWSEHQYSSIEHRTKLVGQCPRLCIFNIHAQTWLIWWQQEAPPVPLLHLSKWRPTPVVEQRLVAITRWTNEVLWFLSSPLGGRRTSRGKCLYFSGLGIRSFVFYSLKKSNESDLNTVAL